MENRKQCCVSGSCHEFCSGVLRAPCFTERGSGPPLLLVHGVIQDGKLMVSAWRGAMAFDSRGRLTEIGCPTLVVAASNDQAVPIHHAKMLHDGITGSRGVIDMVRLLSYGHADDTQSDGERSGLERGARLWRRSPRRRLHAHRNSWPRDGSSRCLGQMGEGL